MGGAGGGLQEGGWCPARDKRRGWENQTSNFGVTINTKRDQLCIKNWGQTTLADSPKCLRYPFQISESIIRPHSTMQTMELSPASEMGYLHDIGSCPATLETRPPSADA